jgi:hypothetical protein
MVSGLLLKQWISLIIAGALYFKSVGWAGQLAWAGLNPELI